MCRAEWLTVKPWSWRGRGVGLAAGSTLLQQRWIPWTHLTARHNIADCTPSHRRVRERTVRSPPAAVSTLQMSAALWCSRGAKRVCERGRPQRTGPSTLPSPIRETRPESSPSLPRLPRRPPPQPLPPPLPPSLARAPVVASRCHRRPRHRKPRRLPRPPVPTPARATLWSRPTCPPRGCPSRRVDSNTSAAPWTGKCGSARRTTVPPASGRPHCAPA